MRTFPRTRTRPKPWLRLVLGTIGVLTVAGCESPAFEGRFYSTFSISTIDRPDNANESFEAASWRTVDLDVLPQPDPDPVLWLRTEVDLAPNDSRDGRPLGLAFGALASHEIYWDGERIGSGGIVGQRPDDEEPGPLEALYAIPDRLATPGRHVVALRTSAHHRGFRPRSGFWYLAIGDFEQLAGFGGPSTRIALISLSGILMVAIFALMMYAQHRKDRSFLFLGLLCAVAALLLVAESWRVLVGYTYNWHLPRLIVVTTLSWSLGLLLLLFVTSRFPLSGRRRFLSLGFIGTTLPLMVVQSWDLKALIGFAVVFWLAFLWSVRALRARHPGARLATLGVAACLVPLHLDARHFSDRNLFPCLIVLLICLLGTHVYQVRRMRADRDVAILRSARLEIELLRRHLQPHFLMNTLTALSEWIDQEPKVAGKLIHSLADELRSLAEISRHQLISVADEVQLCRSHLEVMSLRKGREFRLETTGLAPHARVPPAIFHTLVENAVTHNAYSQATITFQLACEQHANERHYRFTSPLETPDTTGTPRDDGTGLRYIRARLRESFGNRWQLWHGPKEAQWRTEIVVPAEV